MKYLLDTNAVSEPKRKRPDPNMAEWLRGIDPSALYVSVLTIGEIEKGIAKLARKSPEAASEFSDWLKSVRPGFSNRILPVDLAIAETWGRISATRSVPVLDSLLAATALVHNMTLVTRNVRDVADTGVAILNPWGD